VHGTHCAGTAGGAGFDRKSGPGHARANKRVVGTSAGEGLDADVHEKCSADDAGMAGWRYRRPGLVVANIVKSEPLFKILTP
jgi:hypothetical protein